VSKVCSYRRLCGRHARVDVCLRRAHIDDCQSHAHIDDCQRRAHIGDYVGGMLIQTSFKGVLI